MTRILLALAGLTALAGAKPGLAAPTEIQASVMAPSAALADLYRPQVHYSPRSGFMNDPNGLVFANGTYHLFYQYNPFEAKAGRVHWGHATSSDLLHWNPLPVAINETPAGQAFSGSAVLDRDNTSGLFSPKSGGLVAVYTRASPTKQAQELAFSRDGGRTFREFKGNPVLDVGSDSFRDPQVFYYKPSKRWVMSVVRARQHQVVFYTSSNLKNWKQTGEFGFAGVLGVDYECPDLVEVPVDGGGTRWVLFVSINPGAPQGGSAQQYFVGRFDGKRFVADDAVTRFADFGKDFYALQTYSGLPKSDPVAIAWMSNWQYCNATPTGNWRGVMSLPRHLSLRRHGKDWRLVQSPQAMDSLHDRLVVSGARAAGTGTRWSGAVPLGAALELKTRLRLAAGAVVTLRFSNEQGEHVDVGYDADAAQVFIDRGGARGFEHHFFTDKFSAALAPGTREVDMHLVFDRCTLELFAERGEVCASVLHFFQKPVSRVSVLANGRVVVESLRVNTLKASVKP